MQKLVQEKSIFIIELLDDKWTCPNSRITKEALNISCVHNLTHTHFEITLYVHTHTHTTYLYGLFHVRIENKWNVPCMNPCENIGSLTDYQTTNFRFFQTESGSRRQFQT